MFVLAIVFNILRAFFKSKASMAAENLCLRQQVAALCRKRPRPKLTKQDRIFWVWVSRALAPMEIGSLHRQARDGHTLAQEGIQALLG